MKLTLVRFKRGHLENTTFLMTQQGVSFDRVYYRLGHVDQAPGHVVLLLVANDQPARIFDMIHSDRVEKIPEEECD